jgi:flagellar assembly factor FliW
MKLVSAKLGEIDYAPESVIHFKSGLIGLEHMQNFLLLEEEQFAPFGYLQSVDDPAFTLIVINPFLVDPLFSMEMLSEELESIGVHSTQDFMALAIVILSSVPELITVNLKAPLLVNNTSKQARQVLMISEKYGVNDPLIKSGIAAQYKSNPPEKLD